MCSSEMESFVEKKKKKTNESFENAVMNGGVYTNSVFAAV